MRIRTLPHAEHTVSHARYNDNNKLSIQYHEASVYGLRKRLGRMLKRLFGQWRRKNYDIRILSVAGVPQFKKVVFQPGTRATEAHTTLQKFGASSHFPKLVAIQDNELIVEYLRGETLGHIDDVLLHKLSDFYAHVYKREPRLEPSASILLKLQGNLEQLQTLGVLAAVHADKIQERAKTLAPARLWIGFDYTDPIKNNLLISSVDGSVCAIDIKNLHANTLIGQGIAKARKRWLSKAMQDKLLELLVTKGAPDIKSYFAFIRLYDDLQRVANKMVAESRVRKSRKLKKRQKNKLTLDDFSN